MGSDQERPKPMVEIGPHPMLTHIMNIFRRHGMDRFIIAAGYKGEIIQEHYKDTPGVTVLDTGIATLTGDRIRHAIPYVDGKNFFVTYGDGLTNQDLTAEIKFHETGIQKVTITAVHPPARFGQVKINGNTVTAFQEKATNVNDWVNGGFQIVDTEWAKLSAAESWEFNTLAGAAEAGQIKAFKHKGFWRCMDTLNDRDYLEKLWNAPGGAPWLTTYS